MFIRRQSSVSRGGLKGMHICGRTDSRREKVALAVVFKCFYSMSCCQSKQSSRHRTDSRGLIEINQPILVEFYEGFPLTIAKVSVESDSNVEHVLLGQKRQSTKKRVMRADCLPLNETFMRVVFIPPTQVTCLIFYFNLPGAVTEHTGRIRFPSGSRAGIKGGP